MIGSISAPSTSTIEIVWLSIENQYENRVLWLMSRRRYVLPWINVELYILPSVHMLEAVLAGKIDDCILQSYVFCPFKRILSGSGSMPDSLDQLEVGLRNEVSSTLE